MNIWMIQRFIFVLNVNCHILKKIYWNNIFNNNIINNKLKFKIIERLKPISKNNKTNSKIMEIVYNIDLIRNQI